LADLLANQNRHPEMSMHHYDQGKLPVMEPDITIGPLNDHKVTIGVTQQSPPTLPTEKPVQGTGPQRFDLNMNLHAYNQTGEQLKKSPVRPPTLKGMFVILFSF
jgi:hypothetical protein